MRVAVSARMLDSLARLLERQIEKSLAARLSKHTGKADAVVQARIDLALIATGISVGGTVEVDGSIVLRLDLAID